MILRISDLQFSDLGSIRNSCDYLISHLNHQSQPSQKVENWKSSSHLFDQSPRLNMCSGGSAQFSHKFSKRWEEQTSGRGGSTNYLGKLVLHLFSSMIYVKCCFMWMFFVRLSIRPSVADFKKLRNLWGHKNRNIRWKSTIFELSRYAQNSHRLLCLV